MCPNCRAVTDLEADVDDPTDDDLEGEESSPVMSSTGEFDGIAAEQDQQVLDSDDDLLHSTTRLLAIHDQSQMAPQAAVPAESLNGSQAAPDLLSRRGARRISPPFAPVRESPATNVPRNQVQYLRPITPTQPLLGDGELNESATRTPTSSDHFAPDGPMTPTNNAGPFVFDGSAGRTTGRIEVSSMSENESAVSQA